MGFNTRLDEIHAALLNILLPHLDDHNRERAEIAAQYCEHLNDLDVGLPAVLPSDQFTFI